MKRIAIVAAMPGELKPFLDTQAKEGRVYEKRDGAQLWRLTWPLGQGEWIAACAGAGQQAATRAFAAIEQSGPLDAAISIGWVGALSEQFAPGSAYRVSGVIDQRTGERFSTAGDSDGLWLVTSPRIADAAEKQHLAVSYGAGFVDMEAAAVARLAVMRGIPFYAIKGVSDGFRDKLPDFNSFLGPEGEFRLARLILFVVPRPWLWPALVRMGENSNRASKAIAKDLLNLLREQG
jgi:adenosylhomocysteine nucleosidase